MSSPFTGLTDSEMIQMRREQNRGCLQFRIAAAQDAHRIPCVFLVAGRRAIEGQRRVLRKRFEDGGCLRTGLQHIEIASPTRRCPVPSIFTGNAGNCLARCWNCGSAFRSVRDDRRDCSFRGQREGLGSAAARRSFPRIRTIAPAGLRIVFVSIDHAQRA